MLYFLCRLVITHKWAVSETMSDIHENVTFEILNKFWFWVYEYFEYQVKSSQNLCVSVFYFSMSELLIYKILRLFVWWFSLVIYKLNGIDSKLFIAKIMVNFFISKWKLFSWILMTQIVHLYVLGFKIFIFG